MVVTLGELAAVLTMEKDQTIQQQVKVKDTPIHRGNRSDFFLPISTDMLPCPGHAFSNLSLSPHPPQPLGPALSRAMNAQL